jgi:predicted metal-dependent peptidase
MNITSLHTAALDNAKLAMFNRQDGAFLGSLVCNADILWNSQIPTALTDGTKIEINPDWFLQLPDYTRPSILEHELWHIGHLHILRFQGLDHKKANRAADYAINLQITDDGGSFDGASPLLDQKWRGYTMEQIYDQLPDEPPQTGPGAMQLGCWSNDPGDMDTMPAENPQAIEEVVSIVHAAVIAQQRTGCTSKHVDAISETITKRNTPVVDWRVALKDFSQEKARVGLNYKKKNRRYSHVILPARGKRGRLVRLSYFFDVSGSVTQGMEEQMLAEVYFIWQVLKPRQMDIIQFDTKIQKIDTWTEGNATTQIEIVGRGGTSLGPVADWLDKNKPNGAVIMTDLDCPPMRVVKGVPILWLCINNPRKTVQQGKLIHIEVPY